MHWRHHDTRNNFVLIILHTFSFTSMVTKHCFFPWRILLNDTCSVLDMRTNSLPVLCRHKREVKDELQQQKVANPQLHWCWGHTGSQQMVMRRAAWQECQFYPSPMTRQSLPLFSVISWLRAPAMPPSSSELLSQLLTMPPAHLCTKDDLWGAEGSFCWSFVTGESYNCEDFPRKSISFASSVRLQKRVSTAWTFSA